MKTQNKGRWFDILGFILIIFLVLDVIFLTLQNKSLKDDLSNMTMARETLHPGETVDSFTIINFNGDSTQIRYSDRGEKYLLFILSTTCPHCEKNIDKWKELARTADKQSCKIIGVSLDSLVGTKLYHEKMGLNFDLFVSDTSFVRKYKIIGVPETILIGKNGIVEKTWQGELRTEEVSEIQHLIGASRQQITNP